MEIELKDREKEQRDEDADQDQGSSLAMENHIPDCEDPPKPIPPRIKIKTIRSPRLSKDVDLSHGLVKARKDYFGAKTQVKQKRTTLSGKKMDFISHFMPYKQDRDPVKKITTYSFDRPDADDYYLNDISLFDENNSASPPILGYLKEARETKGTFSFNKFLQQIQKTLKHTTTCQNVNLNTETDRICELPTLCPIIHIRHMTTNK